MYLLLIFLNIFILIASAIYILRSIFKTFLNSKLNILVLIILIYLIFVSIIVKIIDLCNLADAVPKFFYELGYSLAFVLQLELVAFILWSVIYFIKKRVIFKLDEQFVKQQNDSSSKIWDDWYNSK